MVNKKDIEKNSYYQVIANPQVYLRNLLERTCYIGLFTLFVYFIVDLLHLDTYAFPATMHSLIGFIIGLLLVFRNNSAYERWWDGRKLISTISAEVTLINARLNVIKKVDYYSNLNVVSFKKELGSLLLIICHYLISKRSDANTERFESEMSNSIEKLFGYLNSIDPTNHSTSNINTSINNIINSTEQLGRIKNTPIPIAYVYHIKISVLIYLVSLPFGMFHDLGLFAVPLVMLLYYIIAGVEIISNEIENPFGSDPNDLPTEDLFKSIIKTIEEK
jgi:putative membrane protein